MDKIASTIELSVETCPSRKEKSKLVFACFMLVKARPNQHG